MTALDHAALHALAEQRQSAGRCVETECPSLGQPRCSSCRCKREGDAITRDYIAAASAAAVLALLDENARMREALHLAEQFIVNGCDLGFIRMPDRGDPALHTLPAIRAALGRPGA